MADATEQDWILDHDLRVLPQLESRPGQGDGQGNRWLNHRFTGKVLAACTCGYTSGLVPPSTLGDLDVLAAAHPSSLDALVARLATT